MGDEIKLPPGYQLVTPGPAPAGDGVPAGVTLPPGYQLVGGPPGAQKEDSWLHGLKNWWEQVNPAPVGQMINEALTTGPLSWFGAPGAGLDVARQMWNGMAAAHGEVKAKAEAAFKAGNYGEGTRHVLNYLIPLFGPGLDKAGDELQRGDIAGGIGTTAGVLTNAFAPEVIRRLPNVKVPALVKNRLNPVERASQTYLENRGVKTPASMQTGNLALRNVEGTLRNEPGGAGYMAGQQEITSGQMQRIGEAEADAIHPAPATPVTTGENLKATLEGNLTSERAGLAGRVNPAGASPENAGANLQGSIALRSRLPNSCRARS